MASLTELGAGVLLIVGLFNPLAAAGVVGVMTVALITNHFKNGFFIFRPGEGYEYVLNLAVAGLALGALGPAPGRSIDVAQRAPWPAYKGLAITAVAGIGGALLLLAIFWRPEKQEKPDEAPDDRQRSDSAQGLGHLADGTGHVLVVLGIGQARRPVVDLLGQQPQRRGHRLALGSRHRVAVAAQQRGQLLGLELDRGRALLDREPFLEHGLGRLDHELHAVAGVHGLIVAQ